MKPCDTEGLQFSEDTLLFILVMILYAAIMSREATLIKKKKAKRERERMCKHHRLMRTTCSCTTVGKTNLVYP